MRLSLTPRTTASKIAVMQPTPSPGPVSAPMHYLEAAFREACRVSGGSVMAARYVTSMTGPRRGEYVELDVDAIGFIVAGTLRAAGLLKINRHHPPDVPHVAYVVTITTTPDEET